MVSLDLRFQYEHLQPAGLFKIRGARTNCFSHWTSSARRGRAFSAGQSRLAALAAGCWGMLRAMFRDVPPDDPQTSGRHA